MNIIGIVAEYNPFHLGHEYHIESTRALLKGESAVICVMSGDFVQRGEAALYSKFVRAEAACACGADLVLELPLPWSLSSAEGFARGAVGMLAAAGAEYISFGSESGNIEALEKLARILAMPELIDKTKKILASSPNLTFASARQIAVESAAGEAALLLKKPNNILAVEYLKAVHEQKLNIKPLTVTRLGSGHDEKGDNGFRSAAELRELSARGEDADVFMPQYAAAAYAAERAKGRIIDYARIELAVLSRLRALCEDDFAVLPDGADGAGARLYAAVRSEMNLEGILNAAKTKRYTLSRIRRMCMCAALGIKDGMADGTPPYLRVLAANARGREVLREITANSAVPVVTKPAHVKTLAPECAALFALGASAHDLYTLGFCAESERKVGEDWRMAPKIV